MSNLLEGAPSLMIERNEGAEADLAQKVRAWVERDDRAPGIHATDLLAPRLAYWQRVDPKPLSDRLVQLFFVGRVLHAFVFSLVEGRPLYWETDTGSHENAELGITYSPDLLQDGMVRELKTARNFTEPETYDDLRTYLEQLLVYFAATNTTEGQLWVLYLNLRDENRRTHPQFRVFDVRISAGDLLVLQERVTEAAAAIAGAIRTGSPEELPLCPSFKCGPGNCAWWDQCRPVGRYDAEGEVVPRARASRSTKSRA